MVWLPLLVGFTSPRSPPRRTPSSSAATASSRAALYAHRAFGGPFLTFLVAFAVLASGVASASAAALAFGGNYLTAFIPDAPPIIAAYSFLAIVTFVNALAYRSP